MGNYEVVVGKDQKQAELAAFCRSVGNQARKESNVIIKDVICNDNGRCSASVKPPVEWKGQGYPIVYAFVTNLITEETQEVRYIAPRPKPVDPPPKASIESRIFMALFLLIVAFIIFVFLRRWKVRSNFESSNLAAPIYTS
eukprot:TRINITY_DN5675_c0_g2_i5.p1 TRINITY_DN5675_c0_g2~~TRINITY_DN5675_c0_g2_i5.p1  ORF type:complete len:141 (-),score=29.72 TRINITY_DN5675_c0_g2_i5:118-540(-)